MQQESVNDGLVVSPNKKTRLHHVYFLVVGFSICTVVFSLLINHQIVSNYENSIKNNQEWATRLSDYLKLATFATAVNAPGNDVFDSLNVEGEENRMREALYNFNNHLSRLEREAKAQMANPHPTVSAEVARINDNLSAVQLAMTEMTDEASRIFTYFRQNQPQLAGQRMATMDRKYAALGAAIEQLRLTVTGIQQKLFDEDRQHTASVQKLEYLIALLVLVLICAATFYGWQAKKRLDTQAHERDESIKELSLAQEQLRASNLEINLAHEELRAANHELNAAQEASRAANHELLVAQEKLRAANEELLATNEQLENRIQEHTEINRSLQESESKFRDILANIEDAYYEVDLAGRVIFFNEATLKLFGYPAEEMLGLHYAAYTDAEVAAEVKKGFNEVFRTNTAKRNFSYPIIQKDGTARTVEASVSLVKNLEGQAIGFRGLLRDITERREAEKALEENLKGFLNIASAVSQGDLTMRANPGEDTLGRIIGEVNRMLDNFSRMLTEVQNISLTVSSSAIEILAASEQIAVGSQRQADEISHTSKSVEEIAASMTQVSRNASQSVDAAQRALEIAQKGDRSVQFATDAMREIETAVLETAEKMEVLGTRSTQVSEIIDMIDDIAAQTNLLALNAAIEAAHAGQAGVGFSVVADEIRKLAERTSQATKDVANLIKTVQSEIAGVASAMEAGCKKVQGGTEVAEEASNALKEISEAVQLSTVLIEEISTSSDEQARITTNLASAMQTISGITMETSTGVHETVQTLQGMADLSEQLNQAVSQFKIKSQPSSPMMPGGNRFPNYPPSAMFG
ncbi:MAG: methyl-accepting chemotaxis protein [Acidobacteriota bacterium]